ncbi:hypothetical protein [Methylovirgula sp. 4M-Z18]|uniref:hypothetical protein n=1 Tax=Methylovirgula sp. 4M-Z18 TaxID=2293567 RepID=UPI000E2EEE21|nr:hypothetical protein [Methylovirgula sp. 4M-Z18]RFB80391.1 hypothetical protein DYH55_02365 [Methylovirgula sp. 4M-Z18]
MANLTSTLAVMLKEDVTKRAPSIERAMDQIRAHAKNVDKQFGNVAGPEKLVKSLQKLKLEAKDIEAVGKAWQKYAASEKLAANASEWTKTQASAVTQWEDQTIRALRQVARERAAFDRQMNKPVKLPKPDEPAQHGGHNKWLAGHKELAATLGAGAAGHELLKLTKESIDNAAERQHEVVQMMQAGIKADEIARVKAEALDLKKTVPNLSVAQLMELHKEARSAVMHPEETFELMPELAKATSVLKAMGAENANVADLVKGAESLGMMANPERFHKFLQSQIAAMSVMGKTISTEQIYEAAKYSKSAGATLSDEFINLTLPSLIQEMHGSSAGDALSMMTKTLRGGLANKMTAVKQLDKLGLLEDPKQIVRTKTGAIHGYLGKVKGDDLLASDPGKWLTAYFKPAAEKMGAKTLSDQIRLLNQVMPSTAANMARILLQQEETLKTHRANYEAAAGQDWMKNQAEDPLAGMDSLNTSLQDFLGTLSGPAMKDAATYMTSFSKTISGWSESLAQWQKDNPELAKWAAGGAIGAGAAGGGALLYGALNGFMTGFGLKGSAVALDESAAALTNAAEVLAAGGGGVTNDIAKDVGGGAGVWGTLRAWGGKLKGMAGLGVLANLPTVFSDEDDKTLQQDADREKRLRGMYGNKTVDKAFAKYKHWYDITNPFNDTFENDPMYRAVQRYKAEQRSKHQGYGDTANQVGRRIDLNPLGMSTLEMDDMRAGTDREANRGLGFGGDHTIPTRAQAAGGAPATGTAAPQVDTGQIAGVAPAAQQAGDALLAALGITVTPQVSTAAIDAFLAKVAQAKAELASLGAGAGGLNVPSHAAAMRGNFTAGYGGRRNE